MEIQVFSIDPSPRMQVRKTEEDEGGRRRPNNPSLGSVLFRESVFQWHKHNRHPHPRVIAKGPWPLCCGGVGVLSHTSGPSSRQA